MGETVVPPRRVVRAGAVTALLDGAFLRRIRVGPHEVVRGVYAAVRDRNWDTIVPRYTRFDVEIESDRFRIAFTAEHIRDDVDFIWDGTIVGEATGRVTFTFDGLCRRAFWKNRVGFCVLHPPTVAGTPYTRDTPSGTIAEVFPDLISPTRDITDMRAIRYGAGPVAVALTFDGDLFDMEDQRNWTDASYKTFCTPLRQPYPVLVAAGQRIIQRVVLDVTAPPTADSAADDAPVTVTIGREVVGRLPALGFGTRWDGRATAPAAIATLRGVPAAHLWLELDERRRDWRTALANAAQDARGLGVSLDVALVLDRGESVDAMAGAIVETGVPLVRLAPFAVAGWLSTPEIVARVTAACHARGIAPDIVGGTRADFQVLNARHQEIPLDALDGVTYAINPQVHAFDDLSLMETIGVQGATVDTARVIVGKLPIVVGPITLRQRFNPVATEPSPPTPGAPPHADPRQVTSFAAAWTVGSLRRLGEAGATALTYGELSGPCGLVDDEGDAVRRYPVFDVFAALRDVGGGALLSVAINRPLEVEALAVRRDDRVRVLVANCTDAATTVRVDAPFSLSASALIADESSAIVARRRPNGVEIELPAYGVAQLDARAAS